MNFHKHLADLDNVHDDVAETFAASVVNRVSEWAVVNGFPSIVRDPTPAAQVTEVRRYLAEAIAATRATETLATDALVDLATAAELLGYKPAGLRKIVKAGKIRFVQNGRGPIRFRREWIDEYIQASKPVKVERSPSQRRPAIPKSSVPGFDPSRFKR